MAFTAPSLLPQSETEDEGKHLTFLPFTLRDRFNRRWVTAMTLFKILGCAAVTGPPVSTDPESAPRQKSGKDPSLPGS